METTFKELKVAYAYRNIGNTVILPIDMLEPIDKIREPAFYNFVKKSFEANGLFHPLVVHPLTVEEWEKERLLDVEQLPPKRIGTNLRYRIQCGCNRYYILKEFDYDAVECAIVEDVAEAHDLCRKLRVDKTWKRGSFNVR